MDRVNVLATFAVDAQALRVMAEADPRVQVAMAPYRESAEERRLRSRGRLAHLKQRPLPPGLAGALREADVLFSLDLPTNVVALAPRLKWVQNIGAGVDHLLAPGGTGLWESDVTITNMGGFNSRLIAEFVLNLMLLHVKRMPEFILAQSRHEWIRAPNERLGGKTAGIVGLGRIGSEAARLCKAFGMTVLANRRTTGAEKPPYVDRLLGPQGLDELLAVSDFVVLALPLVADTAKIIGERELRLMKPTAMLINVARGSVVDEAALVRALREGWIGVAGLDVFEDEPLPAGSPLWGLPNAIVTPHASAAIADYGVEAARFFAQNLQRFIAGRPLLGIVDRKRGY